MKQKYRYSFGTLVIKDGEKYVKYVDKIIDKSMLLETRFCITQSLIKDGYNILEGPFWHVGEAIEQETIKNRRIIR